VSRYENDYQIYLFHELNSPGTGAFQDEWLGQVKPDLEARMAQYEDRQIEFAILSLVRDPLLDLIPRLAENVRSLNGLSARLDAVKPDWREFEMPSASDDATAVLTGPDPMYGMMQEHLDRARYPENVETLCESEAVEDMTTQRQQLVTAQAGLRLSIKEEQQSNQSDEEKAAARRCDYGARMQDFVRRVKTKKRALDEVETV